MKFAVAVTVIKDPLEITQDIQTRLCIVNSDSFSEAENAAVQNTLDANEGFVLHHVTSLYL